MKHVITLPKLGDMVEKVLVLQWLCDVGDDVDVGDGLLLAETDKIETEVPAPVAGRVGEQLVAVNDEVNVGAPICVIED